MNKNIKIVAISIIVVVILIVLLILLPLNSNIKSGDTVNIKGEIAGVAYINTSYGYLPIITLKNQIDTFKNANLLDNEIYNIQGWDEALKIYGDFNDEYNTGNSIDITLYFEEIQLNGAKFMGKRIRFISQFTFSYKRSS